MGRKLPSGISISKHRSGKETLRVSFTYRGVNCRESIGIENTPQNIKYATNMLGEILNRITRQSFNFSEYFPESKTNAAKLFGAKRANITIDQLFKTLVWIDIAPSETTAYTYKRDSKWSIERLGHIPVDQVTAKDIRDWIKDLKHLSRKTITNYLTPLRIALATAVDDQIIDKSPADLVSLGKSSKGLITQEQRLSKHIVNPFNIEEITKILKAAYDFSPQAGNYFKLAIFSGARNSELKGLKWVDIDNNDKINFKYGTMKIDEVLVSMSGKYFTKPPKTKASNRIVNLTPMAYEALKKQQALTRLHSEYVFTRFDIKDSSKPMTHNDHYNRPWKKILTAAGVEHREAKQNRHTYASQMLDGGESPLLIANQMGHDDLDMIYNIYAKYIKSENKKRMEFASDFGSIVF